MHAQRTAARSFSILHRHESSTVPLLGMAILAGYALVRFGSTLFDE
jgi:hypothetical protein